MMTPADIDKAAESLREAYYNNSLWSQRKIHSLEKIIDNLLVCPSDIDGAFLWFHAEDVIRAKGVRWNGDWFHDYGELTYCTEGSRNVRKVLERLNSQKKKSKSGRLPLTQRKSNDNRNAPPS